MQNRDVVAPQPFRLMTSHGALIDWLLKPWPTALVTKKSTRNGF
jgi:hypothetical protein